MQANSLFPYTLFTITLGDTELPVTLYAVCVVAAIALGLALLWHRCRREGLRGDTAGLMGLLGLPLGLIGARIFYVACEFYKFRDMYEEAGGLLLALRLWQGGYALWGAVIGGALAVLLAARITRQPAAKLMDVLAAPAALMIAGWRFAEYFSYSRYAQEGLGQEMFLPFFQRFPFAVYNQFGWYWAVFMLEGLAAAVICAVLLAKRRPVGHASRLFLLLYSACQIVLESMKKQPLTWPKNNFVYISQVGALVALIALMAAGTIRWARHPESRKRTKKWMVICWAALAALAGAIVILEFSRDNKISWLRSLSREGAHLIMAFCAAGMGAAAYGATFSVQRG